MRSQREAHDLLTYLVARLLPARIEPVREGVSAMAKVAAVVAL